MLQTTNSIFNKTLYDYATPKALLAWQRVRTANWLASSGREWALILSSFNSGQSNRLCDTTIAIVMMIALSHSGTYNNQYMVLDLKKIHLNQSIDDDALWVVEQIPGSAILVHYPALL